MNKAINRSIQLFTLLMVFFVAVPLAAKPIHPYAEPIVLGKQSVDIGAMLATAFEATPWTLTKENDELYLGKLSSKGVDVQARISVVDNVLTLTLDSVTEAGCGGNCKDLGEGRASRWLVSLRRSITYELTLRVRDSLQK